MKPNTRSALVLAVAATLLGAVAGCVNGYSRFYTPSPQLQKAARFLLPYSGHTEVYSTDNMQRDGEALVRRGYLFIGSADFHGTLRVTRAQLDDQAREVGADIVLSTVASEGTRQFQVPITTYQPGPVYTTTNNGTVNATAFGSNGNTAFGTANYNGTSTTVGSGTMNTQIMNVTRESYSYGTSFWRKAMPPALGARGVALSDAQRVALQRNGGIVVTLVVDGSPAFNANILVGDVLVAINDDQIESPDQLTSLLDKYSGQPATVTFLRGTETKKVSLQLNVRPPQ